MLDGKKANHNADGIPQENVVQAFITLAVRKRTRKTALAGAKGPTTPILKQGWIEKAGEKLNRQLTTEEAQKAKVVVRPPIVGAGLRSSGAALRQEFANAA